MKVRIYYDPPENRKPVIVDLPSIPAKGDEVVDHESLVANVECVRHAPWNTAAQVHIFLNPFVPDREHEPRRNDSEDEGE